MMTIPNCQFQLYNELKDRNLPEIKMEKEIKLNNYLRII